MGFKGDIDIWKNFIKSLKKLDRSNIFVSNAPKPRIRPNPRKNQLASFIDNRKPLCHVRVEKLRRSEIKKFEPRATVDLHGHTREISGVLETFCSRCILDGIREVTIITGKGEGIVKSATVLWLTTHPEFVIGFFEIKDSRGEWGSFGVRLRAK